MLPTPQLTFERLAEESRGLLRNGARRIEVGPPCLQRAWWPLDGDASVDPGDPLGGRFEPVKYPKVVRQFRNELRAIQTALLRLGYLGDRAVTGESLAKLPGAEQLELKSAALGVWEEIALSIRRIGTNVYRIRAPEDLRGNPAISRIGVDRYITSSARRSVRYQQEITQLERQRDRWRLTGLLAVGTVLLIVATTIFA